jgi:5-formyltetrahydrofolate cyclo-ligase
MNKSELRRTLKQRRLEMSNAEHTVKSREIVERLKAAVDWSGVQTVHFFEPIGELLEADISGLITELEDNYPGISLFAPRQIKGQWEMISLKAGQAPERFDVIIVPMLGFDPKSLHRIGYGGGYYDKFLAGQPKARKIGVCFEAGKTDRIPSESHDVPVDLIVTEAGTYPS